MNATTAASRGFFGMTASGAFSRVTGGVCPEGVAGTVTDVTSVPVPHAMTATGVGSVTVPAFGVRTRIDAGWALGRPLFAQTALGDTTVRKQNSYMAHVITNAGGATGPPRRRAPV